MYKLNPNGVIRLTDNAFIPFDPLNTDWQAYLTWIAEGNTAQPPQSLADAKTTQNNLLNQWRENAIASGITWNGHTWDSDRTSIANLTAAVAAFQAGVPVPPGFTWRTQDNQDIPVTLADLVSLAGAMIAYVNSQYTRSWNLKASVDAAATVQDVAAIIW